MASALLRVDAQHSCYGVGDDCHNVAETTKLFRIIGVTVGVAVKDAKWALSARVGVVDRSANLARSRAVLADVAADLDDGGFHYSGHGSEHPRQTATMLSGSTVTVPFVSGIANSK